MNDNDNPRIRETLSQFHKEGKRVIANQPYVSLTSKVKDHVAEWLRESMNDVYNVLAPVAQYRELLITVDPWVTFYEFDAFNIRTDKKQKVKQFYIHDTFDHRIAQSIGVNLAELIMKTKIMTSNKNGKN